MAAPRKVLRRPTSSSCPGFSLPGCSRVSTLTLARPKSGSTACTRIVTGASGGTRTTFSAGSSMEISGARSGITSMRYSILSMVAGSRRESDAALDWNMSRYEACSGADRSAESRSENVPRARARSLGSTVIDTSRLPSEPRSIDAVSSG